MSARVVARIDAGAITANCERLRTELDGTAALCAVVKADGYGHGAVTSARAALQGGATWLAVATADEAAAFRAEGFDVPVLVMGALTRPELEVALSAGADIVAWTPELLDWIGERGARVHVKLDSGMGRLGTRDPAAADAVARAAGDRLVGLMTHFATADDRDDQFIDDQLERFVAWAMPWKAERPDLVLHAANSAATLRDPDTHFDLARCGVAIYGLDPFGADAAAHGLKPALSLHSWVAALKRTEAGESAGYGRRFVARESTWLATVPIGYGDGWRRGLTNNAEVVVRGQRLPVVGTVSMDNITVDAGPDPAIGVGDEVTLLGCGISAEEVARRLNTINYEVTTALTARVAREVV